MASARRCRAAQLCSCRSTSSSASASRIVSVGEPLYGKESYHAFVSELEAAMTALAAQEKLTVWE